MRSSRDTSADDDEQQRDVLRPERAEPYEPPAAEDLEATEGTAATVSGANGSQQSDDPIIRL